jgi:Tat protein secretion system quality control protein TatD with DNase activity
MKKRTQGHTETSISGDTRTDWSEAFELVPSLQIAYVWARLGVHPRSSKRLTTHRVFVSTADHLE